MTRVTIDKDTLDTMRKVYAPGTKVEAVYVAGLDKGSKGTVKEVWSNGNITVIWGNGAELVVQYPKEKIKVVYENVGCILKKAKGSKEGECSDDCKRCGWNPKVEKQRRKAIERGEMVRGADGLKRLIIRRSV